MTSSTLPLPLGEGGGEGCIRASASVIPDQPLEFIDVVPRQVDVLPTGLERLLDLGAFAELVPRLDSQDVTAAGDRLLQVAFVARAALAIDVEAIPFGSAGAVLGVLEPGPDLRDRQLGRRVEAKRRRAP